MTYKQQKLYRQAHIERTCKDLKIDPIVYKRFLIIGNKIHKRLVYYCNGYMGDSAQYVDNKIINRFEEKEYQAYITPLMQQVEDMAKQEQLYVYFQTDPRGATIYLDNKPIPQNSYNNAYCIY